VHKSLEVNEYLVKAKTRVRLGYAGSDRADSCRGCVLAFTIYSFFNSGIVHWSILFVACITSFIAPPPPSLYFAINIAQYMVPPLPPCCTIQHAILTMEYRVKAKVRLTYAGSST